MIEIMTAGSQREGLKDLAIEAVLLEEYESKM